MPRILIYIFIILVVLSWVPFALIAMVRARPSTEPRYHFFQDMGVQPKLKAQAANPLFADGRAMRPPVPGAVARGRLEEDSHYYAGIVTIHGQQAWATTYPDGIEITEEFLRRGKQRYNIFCATCHGLAGDGDGPIAQRADRLEAGQWGWVPPTSLYAPAVVDREHGHLYNSITHGIRTMPGYGMQIPVEDRWAIVAYIRALQLSRSAGIEDLPPDLRDQIKEPGD